MRITVNVQDFKKNLLRKICRQFFVNYPRYEVIVKKKYRSLTNIFEVTSYGDWLSRDIELRKTLKDNLIDEVDL